MNSKVKNETRNVFGPCVSLWAKNASFSEILKGPLHHRHGCAGRPPFVRPHENPLERARLLAAENTAISTTSDVAEPILWASCMVAGVATLDQPDKLLLRIKLRLEPSCRRISPAGGPTARGASSSPPRVEGGTAEGVPKRKGLDHETEFPDAGYDSSQL